MEYTRDIVLNLTPDGNIPVIRVKHGDAYTRFVRVSMSWNEEPVAVGSEVTALFRMQKPDGTAVLMDSKYIDTELNRYLVVINPDGTVTVELTEQTMSCPGMSICDICLIGDSYGGVISSTVFILSVEASPDISSVAVSSNDFRTLVNAIEDVGKTSPVYLSLMEDVALSGTLDGHVLAYDSSIQKWTNRDMDSYGYVNAQDVNNIISGYGFQTASQVNTLITTYVDSLDANETEY